MAESNTERLPREYPRAPIAAVGAVVVKNGHILLVKRGNEPGYGQWSLPGGAIELGETARAAVAREVKEETGFEVEVVDVIEVLDRIMLDAHGRVRYHYVLIDFFARYISGEFQPSEELLDGRWVLPGELPQYHLTDAARRVIGKAIDMAGSGHQQVDSQSAGWQPPKHAD